MRLVFALALTVVLPLPVFAYSPKQPEHHKRYSPNAQFFIDFNPETDRHKVYAAESPHDPIWSIQTDAFWPYSRDESDGCLFVANDGSSIAGPTWVHRTGYPPDYRVFDGLEFWGAKGRFNAYRITELPSWRLKIIDFPVDVIWRAIHGPEHRGQNLTRQGDEVRVRTIGMRSFSFSLSTGEMTGWNLNANYFAYFALVYALPAWLLVRKILRRRHHSQLATAEQHIGFRPVLVRNLGSILVILNSIGFAFGVLLDSFGGTIDQIGATICRFTYPFAWLLVPTTIVISTFRLFSPFRRFDIVGPWLAIVSALIIIGFFNH